jgi:cyanophycinase
LRGTLLAIGGGLADDNRPVYARFAALAGANGPARIVIAAAASAEQDAAADGKRETLRAWCPGASIDVIERETPTAEAVALIDAATAMFFTGGDQKRITARYRAGEQDSPEAAAMRRLLARGGVIAGNSAGDAMMGDLMLLSGRSAAALGFAPARAGGEGDGEAGAPSRAPAPTGVQLGPGMAFVPWVITDSHFFERDRVGRLVAALEASGQRLGIGVGEDACVEIDLATGDLIGVSVAESLLVDAGSLRRVGPARLDVRARVIAQGARISLTARLRSPPPRSVARPAGEARAIAAEESRRGRRLASKRLFTNASTPGSGPWQLDFDGWAITAWPDGYGEVVFDVVPR